MTSAQSHPARSSGNKLEKAMFQSETLASLMKFAPSQQKGRVISHAAFQMNWNYSNVWLGFRDLTSLSVGHFLRHVQNQLAVSFFHFAQQAAKLVKKACVFSEAAPSDVIRRLPLREIRQLRRFL